MVTIFRRNNSDSEDLEDEENQENYQEPEENIGTILSKARKVGGIFDLNYEDCSIISNDKWIEDAGGVPKHCFLIAVPSDADFEENGTPDSDYAIILRVKNPTDLPTENELREVRAETMREMVTESEEETEDEDVDYLTQHEIQFTGLEAEILGTMFQTDKGIEFGADIDTVYSARHYKVYKPSKTAMSRIASHPLNPVLNEGVKIGDVRFSSTLRRSDAKDAPVHVRVEDFIGSKTGVFGMTRTGKSNTVKIISTSVYQYANENDQDIGQLILDPQGEYANENDQDEIELAKLGDDVSIYKWGSQEDENVEELKLNFFEEDDIENVWGIVTSLIVNDANYVENFKNANLITPEEQGSEYVRSFWRRSAFYAILMRADFKPPEDFVSKIKIKDEVLEVINEKSGLDIEKNSDGFLFLDKQNLVDFWKTVYQNKDDVNQAYGDSDFVKNQLEDILNLIQPGRSSGYKLFNKLRKFHTPNDTTYHSERIYNDLSEGNVVIVDLSEGVESATRFMSNDIIQNLLKTALRKFTSSDEETDKIQVYVEEAHKLFGELDLENEGDPYVTLAKEASKLDIGLIYATQEVSGVDERVLANTANWVVTHLNNTDETKELSKFYNFEEYSKSIRKVDDIGFARIKTKSGKFIVPTQIDEFNQEKVEKAKED